MRHVSYVAREQSQLQAHVAMSYHGCTLCYSDIYLAALLLEALHKSRCPFMG